MAIRITVKDLCDVLMDLTLRGPREEWGEDSEALYKAYQDFINYAGDVTLELLDDSVPAVVCALWPIASTEAIEKAVPIFAKRLSGHNTIPLLKSA